MKTFTTYDLLGVNIAVTNLQLTCEVILDWIKTGQKKYVCIAPVATIVDCQRDPEYLKIVNGAGMTTPDGMPVVWMGKNKGHEQISRTYGPDLLPYLSEFGLSHGLKHYFYGGDDLTLEQLTEKLSRMCPGVKIAGTFNPPMRPKGFREDDDVIARINESGADIIWVGLGSPKQDIWMRDHRERLEAPVMIGVGAAFDFIAGTKKQAPLWMQRSGLEWCFRLFQEPSRLWKRYLVGNTYFMYLILKRMILGR